MQGSCVFRKLEFQLKPRFQKTMILFRLHFHSCKSNQVVDLDEYKATGPKQILIILSELFIAHYEQL